MRAPRHFIDSGLWRLGFSGGFEVVATQKEGFMRGLMVQHRRASDRLIRVPPQP